MVFILRCVRRVADKQVAKGLPMSGRIDCSEPILWREEQELDGIGNGTSTPRQGGQPYTSNGIPDPKGREVLTSEGSNR